MSVWTHACMQAWVNQWMQGFMHGCMEPAVCRAGSYVAGWFARSTHRSMEGLIVARWIPDGYAQLGGASMDSYMGRGLCAVDRQTHRSIGWWTTRG